MTLISSTEFKNDPAKYMDLAEQEEIRIQSNTGVFVLSQENYLEPDEDFYRAISAEEFAIRAKDHLRKLFSNNK